MEYFKDKKITDLNNAEIKEYMNLKLEVATVFPEVAKAVKGVWDAIKPYAEAGNQYNERVLNRDS